MANKDSIKDNGLAAIYIGAGYSTASGDIRATAIQADPSYTNGGESKVDIVVTQSSSDIETALGFDLVKNVKFEKIASFQEKLKFLESLKVTDTSVCVIVRSTVTLPKVTYEFPVILGGDDTEDTLTTDAAVNSFCMAYGDSYVSVVENSAQFIGIYKYECHSVSNKTKFYQELTASGVVDEILVSLSAGTAFELKLEKFKDRQEFSMAAIGCIWPIPSDKSITETAFEFQEIDQKNVTGISSFSLEGYEHVFRTETAQKAFMTVRANREILSGANQEPGLIQKANAIIRAKGIAEGVKSFYSWYGVENTDMDNRLTQIKSDLQEYWKLVDDFSLTPTKPFQNIPQIISYSYGVPSRNCINEGIHINYGGDGGKNFNDRNALQILNNQWRISQITARGDHWMNWIEVTYEKPNGDKTTIAHGKPGGDPATSISLPGEQITSIIVSKRNGDWYQNCLVINTKDGNSMSVGAVPDQTDQVSIFDKGDEGNHVFIGFHGACDLYIDALGGSTVLFKTPTWK